MASDEMGPALFIELVRTLPAGQRLKEVRGYLQNIKDKKRRSQVEALILAALEGNATIPETVVVFVHGILTAGEWQQRLADQLNREGRVKAYPIGVQPVDLLTFLFPLFGRRFLTNVVAKKLNDVRDMHPNAEISVVAHSFGTYLITRLLRRAPHIRIRRLLLCGSIVKMYFDWSAIKNCVKAGAVVNDVGTKDVWPVVAFVGTFGYGPSGALGFKHPYVQDRYFPIGHSDFFEPSHVRDYWVPFLIEGRVVQSEHSTTRGVSAWWARHLPTWPAKIALWAVVWALAWGACRMVRVLFHFFRHL
jgi:pimeloyl-ACP methyl ester carboxylesterase